MQNNLKISYSIFMGMLFPSIVSYLNILAIDYIMKSYGPEKVNGFNMIQFITKSVFMISMSYIGIKILNLEPFLYILLLCLTWFCFHILEAFYTQSIFKTHIQNHNSKN